MTEDMKVRQSMKETLTFSGSHQYHADLVFFGSGSEEMLKIAKDGFYVRGKKVEQGENEATEVYDAVCELLFGKNSRIK